MPPKSFLSPWKTTVEQEKVSVAQGLLSKYVTPGPARPPNVGRDWNNARCILRGLPGRGHLELFLIHQGSRLPSVPAPGEVPAGGWALTERTVVSGPTLPAGHPSIAAGAPLSCSGPPPPPPPPVPPPPTGAAPPPPPPLPAGGAQGASHDEGSVSGLAAALAGAKLRRVPRVSVPGPGRQAGGWAGRTRLEDGFLTGRGAGGPFPAGRERSAALPSQTAPPISSVTVTGLLRPLGQGRVRAVGACSYVTCC